MWRFTELLLWAASFGFLGVTVDCHYMDNQIIGPTCGGNIVQYSNLPQYDKAIQDCSHEEGHCRPLCTISKLGMMNSEGYFVPGISKTVLQYVLPPMKNRFRATEITGAFESCSLSFNFNEALGVKEGCHPYAPLLDCFRKSTIMICEGLQAFDITEEMGNSAISWPREFARPGDMSPHKAIPTAPFIPGVQNNGTFQPSQPAVPSGRPGPQTLYRPTQPQYAGQYYPRQQWPMPMYGRAGPGPYQGPYSYYAPYNTPMQGGPYAYPPSYGYGYGYYPQGMPFYGRPGPMYGYGYGYL